MKKKESKESYKESFKNGLSDLINAIFILLSKNAKYIVLGGLAILFGIIISWKAQRGACLINCNFTDNSKNYYFREKDKKDIDPLLPLLKDD